MHKQKRAASQDIGIEIGAIFARYFLKSEHLHYGYWTEDLDIDIANLHIAQENYTNFLISHIPYSVKTILDVGCGFGKIAEKLINLGYQVDCISPSPFLCEQVRTLLEGASEVFECRYEQLETEKRYDMILFSESFQYIALDKGIEKALTFLNNNGYLLICDPFKKEVKGNNILGGGHELTKFHATVAHYPFELVKDLDMTEQTAPNLDILDDMTKKVAHPALNLALDFLDSRYRLTLKFLRWKYRKQIDEKYKKYFGGGRTGEDFKKFKSYKLFLYRKIQPTVNGKNRQEFRKIGS